MSAPETEISAGPAADRNKNWLPSIVGALGVFVVYFVLAKSGLVLASVHPSATPVWPPTGFAIAVVLLYGYSMAPAIFLGALLANATTAGDLGTSLAIATGNTLECLLAAYVVNRWSDGVRTFETPTAIAKFTLIAVAASAVSASIGVLSLTSAGFAEPAEFRAIWTTWWLGDLAGALLFAPFFVMWGRARDRAADDELLRGAPVYLAAIIVALVAFSPLLPELRYRAALGFLAILPLLWAALRYGQRETATVSVILSAVAVWGQKAGAGPFNLPDPNEAFLLLLAFMISAAVPSLALSTAITARRKTESDLRVSEAHLRDLTTRQSLLLSELNHRVNNILSVVQAIAARTITGDAPGEEIREKLVSRLRALARAQELLVDSSWKGAKLSDLVKSAVEPYAAQVQVRGPDVQLMPRAAQSFALLVHELTTNACKHGALSVPAGRVAVDWSLQGKADGSYLRFAWKESGGPGVEQPVRRGFGMTLLDRAIDLEPGEKPIVLFDPKGFHFQVEAVANRILAPTE